MAFFGLDRYFSTLIINIILPLIALFLLYYVCRGIFLLICYTKIEHQTTINRLYDEIKQRLEYSFLSDGETTYVRMGKFKTFLIGFLFFVFAIFNHEFKQFFYNIYKI